MNLAEELEIVVSNLGWVKTNPELGLYSKSDIVSISALEVVVVEMRRLKEYDMQYFVCPDCGYKITAQEFFLGNPDEEDAE